MGKVVSISDGATAKVVTRNPWDKLREFTSARIALGRSGNSVPTDELLSFSARSRPSDGRRALYFECRLSGRPAVRLVLDSQTNT